jgi:hypothetical protein
MNKLDEATTPIWDDIDMSSLKVDKAKEKSEEKRGLVDLGVDLAVRWAFGTSLGCITLFGCWAYKMEMNQSASLAQTAAMAKTLATISEDIKEQNKVAERVSKIENTRFSAERGKALEDRVLVLEQRK